MGFESIKSTEHVTTPSMSAGEAPRHTAPGHEKCAYYFDMEDFRKQFQDKIMGTQLSALEVRIACPHGATLDGAVYSEDYIRTVRVAVEKVLAAFPEGPGGAPRADAIEELRNAI